MSTGATRQTVLTSRITQNRAVLPQDSIAVATAAHFDPRKRDQFLSGLLLLSRVPDPRRAYRSPATGPARHIPANQRRQRTQRRPVLVGFAGHAGQQVSDIDNEASIQVPVGECGYLTAWLQFPV